jgi:hypothetical protein
MLREEVLLERATRRICGQVELERKQIETSLPHSPPDDV